MEFNNKLRPKKEDIYTGDEATDKGKYKIMRYFSEPGRKARLVKRGLNLAEARKHTNDPSTQKKDKWFDGYVRDEE